VEPTCEVRLQGEIYQRTKRSGSDKTRQEEAERTSYIFCDASKTGYGAVAYQKQGSIIALIAAQSKVAPLPKKSMSIPRLELLSNAMATLLGQYIRDQHWTNHAAHV